MRKYLIICKQVDTWEEKLSVYRVKYNEPTYIGEKIVNTQMNKGTYAVALQLLIDHKMESPNALDSAGYADYQYLEGAIKFTTIVA